MNKVILFDSRSYIDSKTITLPIVCHTAQLMTYESQSITIRSNQSINLNNINMSFYRAIIINEFDRPGWLGEIRASRFGVTGQI